MSSLLARVAEQVYWAARYLERAEGTARIVREYTGLIADLPVSAMSGWRPLLAVLDAPVPEGVDAGEEERVVVELLLADPDNPSSVARSVEIARENLRQSREVIPVEAWVLVNELHLFVTSHCRDSLDRSGRMRFLDHVVAEHQRLIGIFAATMVRGRAYTFLRLGRHVERADMTTRLLAVRLAALLAERDEEGSAFDDHQWMGVLRALSAVQAFRHRSHEPISPAGVLSCVLHDAQFPRSVAYCLAAAAEDVRLLPRNGPALTATAQALTALAEVTDGEIATAGPIELGKRLDHVQREIAEVHDRVEELYLGDSTPNPDRSV